MKKSFVDIQKGLIISKQNVLCVLKNRDQVVYYIWSQSQHFNVYDEHYKQVVMTISGVDLLTVSSCSHNSCHTETINKYFGISKTKPVCTPQLYISENLKKIYDYNNYDDKCFTLKELMELVAKVKNIGYKF